MFSIWERYVLDSEHTEECTSIYFRNCVVLFKFHIFKLCKTISYEEKFDINLTKNSYKYFYI